MKTDRLPSPLHQAHTGTDFTPSWWHQRRPQVKLRNIKYGLISFCDGRCQGEVVKGYQEVMWIVETVMMWDCEMITTPTTPLTALQTHCSHSQTYGVLRCWDVEMLRCWDVEMLRCWHWSDNWAQWCPSLSWLVWWRVSARLAGLPAAWVTWRWTDRSPPTQLGPDQRPGTRDQSKNFTKMQSWTFCSSGNAWPGLAITSTSAPGCQQTLHTRQEYLRRRCSVLNAHVLIKDT